MLTKRYSVANETQIEIIFLSLSACGCHQLLCSGQSSKWIFTVTPFQEQRTHFPLMHLTRR